VYPYARASRGGGQGYTKKRGTLNKNGRKAVIGKGNREELRPGVWRVRHSLGRDPVTGRYLHSPWKTIHTSAKTRKAQLKEVDEFANEYKRELNEKGIVDAPATMTIAKFLDRYHKNRLGTIRESTYEREAQHIESAKKILNRQRLSEITPPVLRAIYANAQAEETLTASELYEVSKLLRKAYRQGVADGLVSENPAESVRLPQPNYKEKEILTAEQAARFKACLVEKPLKSYSAAALLLLETGCRRGEILGLPWKNVLLDERKIVIRQQLTKEMRIVPPKSSMSNRVVAISDDTAERLAAWKKDQQELFEDTGIEWNEKVYVAHALTTEIDENGDLQPASTFIQPRNFNRWFYDFCVDHGFGRYTRNVRAIKRGGKTLYRGEGYEGIVPHSLRHTQSTLLIGSGVDVKTVQARLGHSSPNLTLKQYTRVLSNNDQLAASQFDQLLASQGDLAR